MSQASKKSKLLNYSIQEAFVQCDYTDGFAYIDKAGEILNKFVRENDEVPKFEMNLEGLIIQDITEGVPEIKISSNRIWIHFSAPKNLGVISDTSSELIEKVLDILKPTMYRRIGWRTYFIREDTPKNVDPASKLKVNDNIDTFSLMSVSLIREIDKYEVKLNVKPVNHRTEKDKGALLFDVDIAKKIDKYQKASSIPELRDTIKSDTLLDSMEGLLK